MRHDRRCYFAKTLCVRSCLADKKSTACLSVCRPAADAVCTTVWMAEWRRVNSPSPSGGRRFYPGLYRSVHLRIGRLVGYIMSAAVHPSRRCLRVAVHRRPDSMSPRGGLQPPPRLMSRRTGACTLHMYPRKCSSFSAERYLHSCECATLDAALFMRVCALDRGRAATESNECISVGPTNEGVIGAALWLAVIALARSLRREVGGFAPLCAEAGACKLSLELGS